MVITRLQLQADADVYCAAPVVRRPRHGSGYIVISHL